MKDGRGGHRGSKTLQENASEMLAAGFIRDLGSHRYEVCSQSDPTKFYDVVRNEDNIWKCSCAYCTNR